ncbi:hypothetical protein DDQ68_01595 [Hymenobacter nivis]|uniref:Transposase IS701-like DDE domain-containing protein n=1 Tax=Hymenobacter nivis TaxID=1850093 RepID=A0A2Z3GL13_9BACT|nr:hypothetical protein DDQ68_01595 [Hymenobacter nivis]
MLHDSPEAFLLVDDSVQNKRYSHFIGLTKRQYSGNVHGMVRSVGLVNRVHSSRKAGDFLPWTTGFMRPTRTRKPKTNIFRTCSTALSRRATY